MLEMVSSCEFSSDSKNIKKGGKNMNSGITPTVELATNNGNNGFAYPYPVMPFMSGFGGGSGFGSGFSGDGGWLLILLILLFANNGWGNNGGGFFGGNSFDNGYAWLSNGQKDIMNHTSDGFNSLHLSNQVEGIRDDINDIQNAICNSTASINSNVSNGFYNAEIGANNRQMANMQQAFNSQISTLQGFNSLQKSFDNCCCENRLANCQTQNTIISEANATRFADANNTRDIITNQTQGIQTILDKLCQLELDNVKSQLEAKNDIIDQLRQENLYARGQASQTAQTANIVDMTYSRLRDCPIESTPIYGRVPIFTCSQQNGCGCNGNNGYYFN